jgi:mutator protein MutT
MKVAAGIFRKDDCVLLMRRARTEPLAGEWEYPGGKFEEGEDGPVCLQRELKEELGIDAHVGDFITVAKLRLNSGKELELYAYEILDYTGDITLKVHDAKEWVRLTDLLDHSQLPADLIISKTLVNKECKL